MAATPPENYRLLDVPAVLLRLFHPRPEYGPAGSATTAQELLIPVAPEVAIGARFYAAGTSAPTLLFFHGNGEIVADYEDLGPIYTARGLNFFPVDYRGYGRSTGTPTVTAMMQDCHAILAFARDWLEARGVSGPLLVMGRSLGSASALELAASHPDRVDGLIIESGFAYAIPLLKLLGVPVWTIDLKEEDGFGNLEKIAAYEGPTLIIHAEHDHIIPFADGEALWEASSAADKKLLQIPGANHNDIFLHGIREYFDSIKSLAEKVKKGGD